MDDEKLRQFFQETPAPPVRLEAQTEAVRQARQAWAEARREEVRPPASEPCGRHRHPFPVLAISSVAAIAAVLLVAARLFLAPGNLQERLSTANPPLGTGTALYEKEEGILREVARLFDGRLQFIVIQNGQTHIEVAAEPVFREQPVVLELHLGDQACRVLSYSGNTIQLEIGGELVEFEVLVAGDGEVFMAGEDFIWSSRSGGQPAGVSIEASVISG